MRQTPGNTYRVSVETNHAGKYEARLEVRYAESRWTLRVYFLASSPERLLARVQTVLRYLQRHEEDLWLWGSNASDRGLLFDEYLRAAGVELDRRREFPRAPVVVSARPGAPFRPLQLAELKRKLASRLAPAARVAPRMAPRRAAALRSA